MSAREFDPTEPEWMDRDQPLSQELRDDLLNLETLNRVFGSHSLVCKSVKPWLQTGRPNRILDLATGGGDIPRELVKVARRAGIEIEIDAVDRQPSTLEFARSQSKDFPEIRFQQGDIFAFGNGITWDIVLCSLALHHFSNDDAVAILRRLPSLAERHVLVADLCRSPLATLGIDLLTTLWMRQPMTRNDARVSARRAFSFTEFADLAHSAGWQNFRHYHAPWFRQTLRR